MENLSCFKCIPLLIDILLDQAIGTSTVIIICPLVSLMHNQVRKMNDLGITAATVFEEQDKEVLDNVLDGYYSLVFTSSESMLATKRWEKILKSQSSMEDCCALLLTKLTALVSGKCRLEFIFLELIQN